MAGRWGLSLGSLVWDGPTGAEEVCALPTGKVKWFNSEKGFGFLSREDGDDVYVRASSLPEGVTTLRAGTRVEFGILSGRKGDQAHQEADRAGGAALHAAEERRTDCTTKSARQRPAEDHEDDGGGDADGKVDPE